eukprot:TRINITY_DN5738_c0_g1_i9.p1 TRINITY_DN5738_c0_g1~~TRINITY_DN5738_c0_g1_i9.p1  ORF type:complete len:308 (-),score=63.20 TRINITY_DN5738_c0_g1_i9:21-944(-)
MLFENVQAIDGSSKWSKVKKGLESDPRYHKDILTSKDRQRLFKDFLKQLAKEEEEKRQRKLREEASIREREKEVRKFKEINERRMLRDRERLQQDEALQMYKALLTEKIHHPQTTWSEAKEKISKDKRYKTNSLSREEKERLFLEHLKDLEGNKQRGFRQLLTETDKINITSKWEDIRELIKDDERSLRSDQFKVHLFKQQFFFLNRYKRIPKERHREAMFNRYRKDIEKRALDDFHSLLRDTPQITAASKTLGEEYEMLLDYIRGDKRYKALECISKERENMIKDYIHKLKEFADRQKRRDKEPTE